MRVEVHLASPGRFEGAVVAYDLQAYLMTPRRDGAGDQSLRLAEIQPHVQVLPGGAAFGPLRGPGGQLARFTHNWREVPPRQVEVVDGLLQHGASYLGGVALPASGPGPVRPAPQ